MAQQPHSGLPQVVIVGAGFGGLNAARALARAPVRVTLIDKKNHHTFQPLLYQVAGAVLSPAEIAHPVRRVFRRQANVSVVLSEVTGFDLAKRRITLDAGDELAYDYLIVAAGARHSYFGNDHWEPLAPGLKTIEDALEIRRRILLAFELAEREALRGGRPEPLNFVVIGGGATGVELAGTLAEIAFRSLAKDFRSIDTTRSRVLLLEGAPRVLPGYPEDLSRSAEEQLRKLGVEVRTSTLVTVVEPGLIRMGESALPASVVIWAAGVAASPLGRKLGAEVDKAGRVLVNADLTVPGHPEVYVIGDLAAFKTEDGKLLPGVAQVAIQQGRAAAQNIARTLRGEERRPFRYRDYGSMATIGRAAAVADFGRMRISGFVAWLAWLLVHITWLIGFSNRLVVMVRWAWHYVRYTREAGLITGSAELPGWKRPGD
jgi:NADH dehydrogenase